MTSLCARSILAEDKLIKLLARTVNPNKRSLDEKRKWFTYKAKLKDAAASERLTRVNRCLEQTLHFSKKKKKPSKCRRKVIGLTLTCLVFNIQRCWCLISSELGYNPIEAAAASWSERTEVSTARGQAGRGRAGAARSTVIPDGQRPTERPTLPG